MGQTAQSSCGQVHQVSHPPKPNINPAIAEAWEEGRHAGIREAATRLEGMKQIKEWEGIRGIWRKVHSDGWSDLSLTELKLLKSAAALIRKMAS